MKGKIGVTSENLFPIIKKFLYSDHDIFLREIVSNAVDATQKLKTLAKAGKYSEEIADLKVKVTFSDAATPGKEAIVSDVRNIIANANQPIRIRKLDVFSTLV